jgi:hypothetical protein
MLTYIRRACASQAPKLFQTLCGRIPYVICQAVHEASGHRRCRAQNLALRCDGCSRESLAFYDSVPTRIASANSANDATHTGSSIFSPKNQRNSRFYCNCSISRRSLRTVYRICSSNARNRFSGAIDNPFSTSSAGSLATDEAN